MSIPDLQAAGKVLDEFIRRRWHDGSQWLRSCPSPPCSPATLRSICNGSYNSNAGPTMDLLWRICYQLAGRDENSAQALLLLYLQEAKMVPPSNLMAVHVDLARCQVDLRRASHALEKIARKRERESMVPEAGSEYSIAEPSGDHNDASDSGIATSESSHSTD